MKGSNPKVISLFSGAGGIDLGFHNAGFQIAYSCDNWISACQTLLRNGISDFVDHRDIREINFKQVCRDLGLKDVDCVIGGPPCPPFSKSRFYLKYKKRALDDENSYTLNEYFRAVEEIQPKVFFFENVFGFMYKPHHAALSYLKTRSKELGFQITHNVINTANYGVPQIRERFICIGVRSDLPPFCFPKETHYDPSRYDSDRDLEKGPWVTCQQAIGDLDFPLPDDAKMQAGSRHKDLLKIVPPGDNYLFFTKERGHPNPIFKWRSRYWSFLLKLSPDRPSWTIQASFSNNMGPFHWSNRFLRIPEIKRLQTFDDYYEITGDFKTQWRQIGNAVPPLVAEVIAKVIKKEILEKQSNIPKIYHQLQLMVSD